MLRSVARVDVTMSAAVTNFRLLTIQAFRANNKIRIIPDNLTDPDNPIVSVPSIATGTFGNINTPKLAVTGNESKSKLYLPEVVAPDESSRINSATCIVVGGFYNGDNDTTYYRIDFCSAEHPFGQILRNHRYLFNLTGVSSKGWDTPEQAANNLSSNITVEVKNWNDNTTDMYFDGDHHFGLSTRKVVLNFRAGSSYHVDVDSDITDYTFQWSDANGNPTEEGSSISGDYQVSVTSNKNKL